jgi:hypothetical protein
LRDGFRVQGSGFRVEGSGLKRRRGGLGEYTQKSAIISENGKETVNFW